MAFRKSLLSRFRAALLNLTSTLSLSLKNTQELATILPLYSPRLFPPATAASFFLSSLSLSLSSPSSASPMQFEATGRSCSPRNLQPLRFLPYILVYIRPFLFPARARDTSNNFASSSSPREFSLADALCFMRRVFSREYFACDFTRETLFRRKY